MYPWVFMNADVHARLRECTRSQLCTELPVRTMTLCALQVRVDFAFEHVWMQTFGTETYGMYYMNIGTEWCFHGVTNVAVYYVEMFCSGGPVAEWQEVWWLSLALATVVQREVVAVCKYCVGSNSH